MGTLKRDWENMMMQQQARDWRRQKILAWGRFLSIVGTGSLLSGTYLTDKYLYLGGGFCLIVGFILWFLRR